MLVATTGNILDTIIIIMKRKEKKNLPAGSTPETYTYTNR